MTNNPGAKLWVRASNFDHPVDSASRLVNRHPFNQKLQLTLPVPARQQLELQEVPDFGAYFYAFRANLAAFISPGFAQLASSEETLSCVCLERLLPACVTPDRHLHLLVPKTCHQQLGVPGVRLGTSGKAHSSIVPPQLCGELSSCGKVPDNDLNVYGSRPADTYHVDIHLAGSKLASGPEHHERVSRYKKYCVCLIF